MARRLTAPAAFKVATLLLASAAGLALVEFTMRWTLGADAFVQSDVVDLGEFYVHPLNATVSGKNELGQVIAYETDALGLRSSRAAPQDAPLRVLVLGDSFVEAANTPDAQSSTVELGRELRARIGMDIGVINGGVWGFSNARSFFLLDYVKRELDPSVVLLMVYLGNDLRDNYRVSSETLSKMAGIVGDPSTPAAAAQAAGLFSQSTQAIRKLAARSYLLTYLYRARDYWGDYYVFELETYRNEPAPQVKEAIERTRQILGYMARYCAQDKLDCVVAGIPSKAQVYQEFSLVEKSEASPHSRDLALDVIRDEHGHSFDNPSHTYQRICDDVGLPYNDLLPVFRQNREQELYYKIDRHWKAPAEQLAARVLARWIGELQLASLAPHGKSVQRTKR